MCKAVVPETLGHSYKTSVQKWNQYTHTYTHSRGNEYSVYLGDDEKGWV